MSDFHNPLSVAIPSQFASQHDFPTEVIAQRFQAYRFVVKDLVTYLRQYASVQEEIVRQQVRLQQAAGSVPTAMAVSASGRGHAKVDKEAKDEQLLISHYFLPVGNGSVQDISGILTKFHQQNIQNGNKTLKEINTVVIPKLEDLRKDLLIKIKEIKNLQNDFKNSLGKEVAETKTLLAQFNHAIDVANHLEKLSVSDFHDLAADVDSVKNDPYLVKLKLDRQLKRQLTEENYLYDAYKNLQTSSEKLESIVVLEIQNYLRVFLNLVETEHASVSNYLVPSLTNGFLAKESNFEWDSFVNRNLPKASSISNTVVSGKLIDLLFPARKMADLNIPHYDSLVNVAVKEGPLERRSKFLKSYLSGWYVLTCSYIHEFKTPDRRKDQTPVMSLSLDYCLVSEHLRNDGKLSGTYKFVLYSKLLNGLIHRGHNWVFRSDTYQGMIEWYNDIKTLTSLASPAARAKAMAKKLQANNLVLLEKKMSRASSVLSAESGKSVVSSKLQRKLSPNASLSVRSARSARSARSGLSAASTQNPRLLSTFSQKYQQLPKLSNLINSDGTIVTPLDTHADDDVDGNGDVTITTDKSEGPARAAAVPVSFTGTPQQNIYYQTTPQPQQFYDPVLQQFFTINAIPALQVVENGHNQPMPQYFPSLPQANGSSQYFPALPNLQPQMATSPRALQGQFIPVQDARYSQYIPHFPQQLNEGVPGNAPYPVQLGDNLVVSRQDLNDSHNEGSILLSVPEASMAAVPTAITTTVSTEQEAEETPNGVKGPEVSNDAADVAHDVKEGPGIDDQVSKLSVADEKAS